MPIDQLVTIVNTNSFPGDVRNPKDERNVRVG